jgi:hypothetical protein
LPIVHGATFVKNGITRPRFNCWRTTTWPAASMPCTWKTDFAMSRPKVVIVLCDLMLAPPNQGDLIGHPLHGALAPAEGAVHSIKIRHY